MKIRARYFRSCVNWPRAYVESLNEMIDGAHEIQRPNFLKYVNLRDLQEIERKLGYSKHPTQGMTMASDYHVTYHRSELDGKTVWFFKHSAIEYVFK